MIVENVTARARTIRVATHCLSAALLKCSRVRSLRWCRRSTSFASLTRAARYAGRLWSEWIFFTSIGLQPACRPPRKRLGASSPSLLIGWPDHSAMFPAAPSRCASSRHLESRRSRCAADSVSSTGNKVRYPMNRGPLSSTVRRAATESFEVRATVSDPGRFITSTVAGSTPSASSTRAPSQNGTVLQSRRPSSRISNRCRFGGPYAPAPPPTPLIK
jgi:hypothetical protein